MFARRAPAASRISGAALAVYPDVVRADRFPAKSGAGGEARFGVWVALIDEQHPSSRTSAPQQAKAVRPYQPAPTGPKLKDVGAGMNARGPCTERLPDRGL